MAHSSWGSGWPNCQTSRINKNFTVITGQGVVTFPGGIRWEIGELVNRLVRETSQRGYRFGISGNPSYGCWGFDCRPIANSSKASNHSWGLAVDINAPRNPQKRPLTTDMPPWMIDLWKQYGFRWGGDYTLVPPDPMHYEFRGSVTDAKQLTEMARLAHLGEVIVPVPPPPGGSMQLAPLNVERCEAIAAQWYMTYLSRPPFPADVKYVTELLTDANLTFEQAWDRWHTDAAQDPAYTVPKKP